MQFTLQTLLLAFVLIWSSLAAFGPGGLVVAAVLLGIVAYIRSAESIGRAALKVFGTVFLLLLLVALITPSISKAREAAWRVQRMNNERQISLALLSYHDANGHFPPAYVLGPDGKPWHSWRVLILPYMELGALHSQYSFDEPWNGPSNRKLAAATPSEFACHDDPGASANGLGSTSYVAVVGPQTAWPGDKPARKSDFAGMENSTILLVEVTNSGINWLEPRDLSLEEGCTALDAESGEGRSSRHVRKNGYFYHDQLGVNAAFIDGHARFIAAGLPRETLAAILRGEAGPLADLLDGRDLRIPGSEPAFHWAHLGALVTLVLSFLLVLLRPRRKPLESASPEPFH